MNKMVKIGALCLALVLGLVFVGCKDDFQKVEFGSTAAPKNVTATYVGKVLTVTFTVVPGSETYEILYKQADENRIYIATGGTYDYQIGNTDIRTYTDSSFTPLNGITGFRVGVRAKPVRNDKNPSITWASGTF